jgi:hypothetical protein
MAIIDGDWSQTATESNFAQATRELTGMPYGADKYDGGHGAGVFGVHHSN